MQCSRKDSWYKDKNMIGKSFLVIAQTKTEYGTSKGPVVKKDCEITEK